MTDTLPLIDLYERVEAAFAAEALALDLDPPAVPPPFFFGRRALSEQGPIPRVVFVPEGSGFVAPLNPRRPPTRSLFGIEEGFAIYVVAQDPAQPDVERAQYAATRLLADAVVRHCQNLATTNFVPSRAEWVEGIVAKRRGAALKIECSITGAIPDAPLTYVLPEAAHEAGSVRDTSDGSTWIPGEPEDD